MLIALWATEPLDFMNQALQHREASDRHQVLLDMVADNGLLHNAEAEAVKRLTNSTSTLYPLSLLVHHVTPDTRIDIGAFVLAAVKSILSILAHIWARMTIKYDRFPWLLLRLVDDRTTEFEKAPMISNSIRSRVPTFVRPDWGLSVWRFGFSHPRPHTPQ